MFQETDPDEISRILTTELDKAAKKLIRIKRIQRKKSQQVYWNRNLEAFRGRENGPLAKNKWS